MEQTFAFQKLPSVDELDALVYIRPPFAVEARQGQRKALGMGFCEYHEFIECDSVTELHDFLSCAESGPTPGPFWLSIEEIS